jgi:phosphoribosylformylglycinamidine synthase subunit PurQ / glutaminase
MQRWMILSVHGKVINKGMPMKPRALILLATGTNRDLDAACALELAGAEPAIVPLNDLRNQRKSFSEFQILVLPGGFSYADALGAGKLLALELQTFFSQEIQEFIGKKKPVIGICNGFQALVKAGILPALPSKLHQPQATLTFNQQGKFECRWVTLKATSEKCIWTRGMVKRIHCPIAHGEGNFITASEEILGELKDQDQIAFTYVNQEGTGAYGDYPTNPNGSQLDIAGICNPEGNVLGLMPHPENHIYGYQHPRRTRGESWGSGLPLFQNGVLYSLNS